MSSRARNSIRNMVVGCFYRIISIAMPFFMRTLIVYYLGAQFLGLDSLFVSVLQMLNVLEMGFAQSTMFFLYEPIAKKDTRRIRSYMYEVRRIYQMVGCLIFVAGLLIMPLLPKIIKGAVPDSINLYVLFLIHLMNTVLGYWFFAYKVILLEAHQRNDISNKMATLILLCRDLAQVIVIILFRKYSFYITLLPVFTLIHNLSIAYATDKQYGEYLPQKGLKRNEIQEVVRQAIGFGAQKLGAASKNQFDGIVVSMFFGLTEVAIFGNYFSVYTALRSFLLVFITSICSPVGDSIAVESREKNYHDFLRFNFIYAWITCVLTSCLLCLFQPFMKLWMGSDMMYPFSVVVSICIYFCFNCVDVRFVYNSGAGLWKYIWKYYLLDAMANVVLDIWWGKAFGVIGVISATIFTNIVFNFLMESRTIFRKYFNNNGWQKYIFTEISYMAVSVLICGVSLFLCNTVRGNAVTILVLRVLICVSVSNVLLFLIYRKTNDFYESVSFLRENLFFNPR